MVDQEPLDPRTGKDQAAERPEGDDVGDRRFAEDDRDLAEELAASDPGALDPVDRPRPPRPRGSRRTRSRSGPGGGSARPRRRRLPRTVWTIPASCGSVRSANRVKPAIASTSSSRADHGGMVPDPGAQRKPFVLTRRARPAQHGSRPRRRHGDPEPRTDHPASLRGPGCSPASTPTASIGSPAGSPSWTSRPIASSPARARSAPASSSSSRARCA